MASAFPDPCEDGRRRTDGGHFRENINDECTGVWTTGPLVLTTTTPPMALTLRRQTLSRLLFLILIALFVKLLFFPAQQSFQRRSNAHQIKEHNFIERATRPDRSLNVHRHPFLQARMGRDEKEDIFSGLVRNGVWDYWERFQMP